MTTIILTDSWADQTSPTLRNEWLDGNWPNITSIEDITGQPVGNLIPSPNAVILKVEADIATAEALDADNNYLVHSYE